ncbi:transposase [Mangrovibacterium lignilyticum]|uniref:transposase n=1 Tax=Mangrovibacterium lignilyticum TaxID=2668052 RepID=UPI0013D10BE8|nr:transposase [Mangrovibacterium lignilyticum]
MKEQIYPISHILAWVLMPNHFHLLIEATTESCSNTQELHRPTTQQLSKNIGSVLSSYTQALNKQEGRRGKLFSHNTKAKMLNSAYCFPESGDNKENNRPDYATTCFQYIHQNPMIAGLVEKPGGWEFSSFRDYVGDRKGKLISHELAVNYINLDFENFSLQSEMLLDELLLKNLF